MKTYSRWKIHKKFNAREIFRENSINFRFPFDFPRPPIQEVTVIFLFFDTFPQLTIRRYLISDQNFLDHCIQFLV